MILNIVLTITAITYWYVTDNWWLAVIGIVASVIVNDDGYLIVIVLTAVIGWACVYYIFRDLDVILKQKDLAVYGITFLYMNVAFIRAKVAFDGN